MPKLGSTLDPNKLRSELASILDPDKLHPELASIANEVPGLKDSFFRKFGGGFINPGMD